MKMPRRDARPLNDNPPKQSPMDKRAQAAKDAKKKKGKRRTLRYQTRVMNADT